MRISAVKLLALSILVTSCSPGAAEFLPVVTGAGAAVDVATQRSVFELTGKNPSQLSVTTWALDEAGQWIETEKELRGVSYRALSEDVANDVVRRINAHSGAPQYSGFKTNLDFDESWNPIYDVAVVAGYSDYDLLSAYEVSGPNYDVTNEAVIEQIQAWREHMTIEFVTYDRDRFEARITDVHPPVA